MERPRLKTTTEVLSSPGGDICLLRPSADSDLVIEGAGERDRELVAALDGFTPRAALEADFGAASVTQVLELLDAEGLVEDAGAYDALTERERGRFDRQLRYFADVAPDGLSAPDCQLRLRDASVLVLGMGGLGSWAALSLACCGVGELTLVDGDEVELSNLNRQVLYSEDDLGRPKALVAAAAIERFNSATRVVPVACTLGTPAEIAEAVRGSSFVVDAADRPVHDIERWVNAACFEHGVPYVTMSHFPPFARVGPLYVPGETGCFNCQERAYRQSYELYDHIVEQRRGFPSPAGTLGPVCAFIGGQVALDVVHHLTGLCTPASQGKVRVFDTRTLELTTEPVPRDPHCEVCGGWARPAGYGGAVIVFSGAALDRAPTLRRDAGWLEAQRADQGARAVLMSERGVWIGGGRLAFERPGAGAVFLGLMDGVPVFADYVEDREPEHGRPAGLREAATELPATEAALAAYAGSLLAWHRRHRFCANCGAATEPRDGGHERFCPACEAHHFPRTDPVVIVRVSDGADALLLGRQARWPEGRFSLLAGYVEPGETLEEAVRREVLEEAGVALGSVSYIASQPWPFPSSLMLGFSAVAERGEPTPGDDELAEVGWFERADLEAAARGDGPLMLAPTYSIARRLIDAWLAEPGR